MKNEISCLYGRLTLHIQSLICQLLSSRLVVCSCTVFLSFCLGLYASSGFEFHYAAKGPLLLFLQITLVLSSSIHSLILKGQGRGGFSTVVTAYVFPSPPEDNVKYRHSLASLLPLYTTFSLLTRTPKAMAYIARTENLFSSSFFPVAVQTHLSVIHPLLPTLFFFCTS